MSASHALKAPPQKGSRFRDFCIRNRYVWLAFLVPFVLMVTAFAIKKVSPFGDQQILVTDQWHQYYPFLADFQYKLKHGESLFWSWSVGGGVNFFALMSYYVASPLNFLTIFLPYEWLREFLMFTVAARIALAGTFTAYFLKSVYKRNDISLLMFGLSFSFGAFLMGYYWNNIWLDTVCITPLVALGTVKLLTENRFRLFTVSLALSLLMNYYIGLFTCIFVLLIFIAYSIVYWSGIKSFFVNLIKTGAFSVIAIGMTTFFLLPAFMALQNTHASGSAFPSTFAINIGGSNDFLGVLKALKSITGNFANFTIPATKEADALPNICCGAICLFFGFLSLSSPKIKLREKIVSVSLILFMFLSCVIRQLDYIWHGFHFTNMIPYRFAYLITFIVVVMAFRAYMNIDKISVVGAIVASLLTFFTMAMAIGDEKFANMFKDYPGWLNPTLIAFAIITAAVSVLVILYTKRLINKSLMTIILVIMIILQSGFIGYCGVNRTTVTGTYDYPRGEERTETVIKYMDALEEGNKELWRTEMTSTQTLNDGALNHYYGLSMFNSMANENMTRFFENFGMMGWKSGNRYTYAEGSPVTNMFMNLKYLIARDGKIRNTYDTTELTNEGEVKLFLNNHYLPMGFMTDKNLMSWQENDNEDQFNPFDQQNQFFKLATGIQKDVYTRLEVVTQGHSDANSFPVNKESYGNYSFRCTDTTTVPHLKWNYEAPESGIYCAYTHITQGDEISILRNDADENNKFNMQRSYIACIGYFNKGDKISVYCDLKAGASGTAQVYVNMLNSSVLEEAYNKLSQSVMTTTARTDSSMSGTINVKQDGLFYTSIPYEKGWKAVVDGKEVTITPVGNSLLAFPLNAGEHTIELTYLPNGFVPGVLIALVCAALFAGMCVLTYVFKKKIIPEPVFESQLEDEESEE